MASTESICFSERLEKQVFAASVSFPSLIASTVVVEVVDHRDVTMAFLERLLIQANSRKVLRNLAVLTSLDRSTTE